MSEHVFEGELRDYGITDSLYYVDAPGTHLGPSINEALDPHVGKQVRITLKIEEL